MTQVHEDLYDTHSHLDTVKNAPGEHFHHELEVARVNYMLPKPGEQMLPVAALEKFL